VQSPKPGRPPFMTDPLHGASMINHPMEEPSALMGSMNLHHSREENTTDPMSSTMPTGTGERPIIPNQMPASREREQVMESKSTQNDKASNSHNASSEILGEKLSNNSPDHTPPSEETSQSVTPTPPMSPMREVAFVFIICASNLLTQAALGQTIVPLQIIGASLGASNPGQLSWFVAAYSLTVGTFILIAGRLGDIFGHKILFVTGFFWYGFWSLVAGLTVYPHSQIFFDVCRALQGIGPAMMVPNSLAILGRTYPPGRRKEMIFSIYGATAPNGFIVGAVFGTLLAEFASWPWEFYIMAITCCIFGTLAILVVPSCTPDTTNRTFDYLGSLTGVAGLVLFNVAWNQAPIAGWSAPYVLVLLILGLLSLALFLFIETKVPAPLIPRGTLSGKVGFVLGCIVLGWASFGIWVYYWFQIIENLRHVTPLLAAAQVIPCGISGCCAALTTGYVLSRIPTSLVMAIAMLAFCLGNILLATMPVEQTYWSQAFVSTVVMPWGMDMSFPAATIILSDFVAKEHQGIAASLVVTVVNYSISIGLGIAGTTEVHVNNGGQDLLRGYRGAVYAGIGLSGLGCFFALYYVLDEHGKRGKSRERVVVEEK